MPQVPRLQQQQVQGVNQGYKVSADAPIEAFGGGRTREVVFNQVAQMTEKIKKNADDVATMEAENKLAEWGNEFMYGENGASKRQGKNAFGLKDELDQAYAKKRDELTQALTSDAQKAKFYERATGRKLSLDKQVMVHVGNEVQRYDDQTTKDYLNSEVNAAIANYQSPERVAESLYRQEQAMLKFSDRHGLSPESTKAEVEKLRSGTHSGIVSKMLDNGDDISAENYYKQNAGSFLEEDKRKIEQEIEIGSTKGKSQRFADTIMARGLDEKQAYAEAAKTFGDNPRLREAAEARIARQFDLKRQGERDQQERLFEYAVNKFDESGSLDNLEPKIVAAMKPELRQALDKYRDQNPIRDDGALFYKLSTMAADPATRDKFKNADLMSEMPNLSREHFEKLRQYQKDLREGKDSSGKELDGAFSDAQIIQSKFEDAGFKTDNDKEWPKFKLKVDDEIIKTKKATGKTFLNNSEIAEIANKMVTDHTMSKGWIFDTKKPRFQIDVENDISPERLKNIKNFLNKKNIPITEDNIIRINSQLEEK